MQGERGRHGRRRRCVYRLLAVITMICLVAPLRVDDLGRHPGRPIHGDLAQHPGAAGGRLGEEGGLRHA